MDFTAHRKKMFKSPSSADKLCYAMLIQDDVVMNKDGSISMHYKFYGDDIQVMSDIRKMQVCKRYSDAAVRFWHDNLLIESNYIRSVATDNVGSSDFPDPVSQLIDIERCLQFEQDGKVYESGSYISFTAKEPPQLSVGVQKLIEKVHFSKKKPEDKNIALTNKKEKMIKIYKNNKWKYQNKDEIMDEIINTNYTRIDDFYSEKGKEK